MKKNTQIQCLVALLLLCALLTGLAAMPSAAAPTTVASITLNIGETAALHCASTQPNIVSYSWSSNAANVRVVSGSTSQNCTVQALASSRALVTCRYLYAVSAAGTNAYSNILAGSEDFYITVYIGKTHYPPTFGNWLLYIFCFGWLWMK